MSDVTDDNLEYFTIAFRDIEDFRPIVEKEVAVITDEVRRTAVLLTGKTRFVNEQGTTS